MFKDRLKELRSERNITQEQLAKIINLTQSTVAGYENGSKVPTIETVVMLSKYFNVTSDYLLGLNNNRNTLNNKPISYNINHIERYYEKLDGDIKALSTDLIMSLLEKLYNFQENSLKKTTLNNPINTDEDIQRELESYKKELLSKKAPSHNKDNYKDA